MMQNLNNAPISQIGLSHLIANKGFGRIVRLFTPLLDWLLGFSKLKQLYLEHQFSGIEKQAFTRKLIDVLGVNVQGVEALQARIPKQGGCILVCNHPYGMIEGVIMAHLCQQVRPDSRILANVGLKIFQEIQDYFIFANPLKPKAAINTSALKQCFYHVKQGGVLVVFPAGRVSFYQAEYQRIRDGEWNRIAASIAQQTQVPVLPIFISGTNSELFHRLGRIYYRFRLLMLAREMLKLQNKTISLSANKMIDYATYSKFKDVTEMTDWLRVQSYLNDADFKQSWPVCESKHQPQQNIMPPVEGQQLQSELIALPSEQCLHEYKQFSVYYGYQSQMPNVVKEITRLREVVFRTLDEGSGEPCDTDQFDASYVHLLVFNQETQQVIGAYRFGLTDQLQLQGGKSALYLSQMFHFSDDFVNQQQPCMEMGRSFIVPEYQNSFHGLLLLWKGIGTFVARHPQYKTLYGTVSLSKVFDPRSVALMNRVMVTPTKAVQAKIPFNMLLHPEVDIYLQHHAMSIEELATSVKAIEQDGKDIPVLLRQYHKLGAKFHCLGIDTNFNQTPGMLLSVDLTQTPKKLLKLYMGAQAESFLAYHQTQ